MKVKELIKELNKLDPERNIWIIYDGFYPMEPDIDSYVSEEDVDRYKEYDENIEIDDYCMQVW
jgi:hypothetical protein